MDSPYSDGSSMSGGGDGGLPPTVPPPHWIANASCYTPMMLDDRHFVEKNAVGAADVAKAAVVVVSTVLTVTFNLIFITVLSTRYYSKFLRPQPRYLLSAGALNELVHAILVLAPGVYPALFECWPLGKTTCQMQALVRGACSQNSSLVLIVLAVERYVATMHPFSYNSVCDKKVCLFVLLLSCSLSACFFAAVVLHPHGFHFNVNGLMVCEPYYLSNNALILASCVFYFPTTMALMYCYGTIFHTTRAKTKYRNVIFATLPCLAGQSAAAGIDKFMVERRRNDLASRSSAAISLTFIILVTPWAIQQVITSVTRTTAPSVVDFFVSWLAASHSFWTPAIYWMLNPKFRRALSRFFIKTVMRRPLPLTWSFPRAGENADEDDDSSVVGSTTADDAGRGRGGRGVAGVGGGRRGMRNGHCPHEAEGEKFWGEILERSFSCHNLRGLVGDNLDSLYSSSSSSNLRLSSCVKHKNNNNGELRVPNGSSNNKRHKVFSLGASDEDEDDLTSSL